VYLRNLFLKRFAMTPVKYVNHLRLTRAAEMLSSQMYAVRDVCFLAGFQDESYFSREFKKHFGSSPKEYAKASRL
jgi:transcriptional regulator GlxA family with amidase domain